MSELLTTNINKFGEIDKKAKIGKCIFPFQYYKKNRNECVDGKKGKWCATELKEDKTYKHYGYCIDKKNTIKSNSNSINNSSSKKSSSSIKLTKKIKTPEINLNDYTVNFHIKKEINTIDDIVYYQLHLYYISSNSINKELILYETSNITKYQYNNIIGNIYTCIWSHNELGKIQFEPLSYLDNLNISTLDEIMLVTALSPLQYKDTLQLFKQKQKVLPLKKSVTELSLNISKNQPILLLSNQKQTSITEIIHKDNTIFIKTDISKKLYSLDEFKPLLYTSITPPQKQHLTYQTLLEGDYVGILNENRNKILYFGTIKKDFSDSLKYDKGKLVFVENTINDKLKFQKLVSNYIDTIIFLNQEQIKFYQRELNKYVDTQYDRYQKYKDTFKLYDNVILRSKPDIGTFNIVGFVIWSDIEKYQHIGEDVIIKYNNSENPYKLNVSYEDIEKIKTSSRSKSSSSKKSSIKENVMSSPYRPNTELLELQTSFSPPYQPNSTNLKIVDLIHSNIYQELGIHKQSPIIYGWEYVGDDMENIGGERYISLLLNSEGRPTDNWELELNNYQTPLHYVNGWNNEELIYQNGEEIPVLEVIKYLKENQVPNNWNKMILSFSKSSKVVRLPSIPSPPKYETLKDKKEITKESSTQDYQDIVEPELNIIPYNINEEYQFKKGDLVMIKHGVKNPLNGLTGKVIQIKDDLVTISPEKGILDTDEPVELFIEDLIPVKMLYVTDYWDNVLSTSEIKDKNYKVKNCENRFFNTVYKYINNEYINKDKIIVNKNTNIPIYDTDNINPIIKADRLAFIRRGRIISQLNGKTTIRYRLWYIYSKNNYSDKINIFYFNYGRNLTTNMPPKYGWYGGKDDKKGKNIRINFNNINDNLKIFQPSRLEIIPTTIAPLKTQYKQNIKCINCESNTHDVNKCPNPPIESMPKCKICNKKGHWERDCPSVTIIKNSQDKSSISSQQTNKKMKTVKKETTPIKKPNKLTAKKLALLKKNKK